MTSPVHPPGDRRALRRPVTAMLSLLVMCGALLAGMVMPVPYVIERPGPAIDVLGEYEGEKILDISGEQTYPTDGELMMTTVSVDGGPGYRVVPAQVLAGWASRDSSVAPRELLFPPGQTQDETSLLNMIQMSSSQQDAVAAALDELEIPYTRTIVVAGVQNDAPAEGTLEAGDVVLALDGKERESIEAYQRATAATPAGEDVRLRIERDGETLEVQVPTEQVDGDSRMGIMLAPGYDFPIEVTITVDGIGGPSAGTMFALSIYDELTPGDLTGGQSIAGTGTIDSEGAVGPIGGIRQKLVGARSQGADYFLAPGANCEQVVGHVPDGLAVVRVDTFDDALEAVRTIGETGDASTLPSCDT